MKWDQSAGPAQNAGRRLPGLVSAYFAFGRELLAGNPKPAELHALRLETKRLRYTLELFRPCYGPGLRTRIDSLRRLQQLLGDVNDCATASQALAGTGWANSQQRGRIEQFLRRRRLEKTGEFSREWNQVFDAPGKELWWTGYLARQARTPGRKVLRG